MKYLASEAAVQSARRAAIVLEWLVALEEEEDNAVLHVNVRVVGLLALTCHPRSSRDEIVHVGLSKVKARLDLIHQLFLD